MIVYILCVCVCASFAIQFNSVLYFCEMLCLVITRSQTTKRFLNGKSQREESEQASVLWFFDCLENVEWKWRYLNGFARFHLQPWSSLLFDTHKRQRVDVQRIAHAHSHFIYLTLFFYSHSSPFSLSLLIIAPISSVVHFVSCICFSFFPFERKQLTYCKYENKKFCVLVAVAVCCCRCYRYTFMLTHFNVSWW